MKGNVSGSDLLMLIILSLGLVSPFMTIASYWDGIGKMGRHAFEFVDFLKSAGVKCWQILPLSPTSYGDSPYQSFSVNAGNPYFIDFEVLEADGLLEHHEYASYTWESEPDKVDYSLIYQNCFEVLRLAHSRFKPAKSLIVLTYVNLGDLSRMHKTLS